MSNPNEENLINHTPHRGQHRLLKLLVNTVTITALAVGKRVRLGASPVCAGIVNEVPGRVLGKPDPEPLKQLHQQTDLLV